MFTVLLLMGLGIAIGFAVQHNTSIVKRLDPVINVAIYALLFFLGVSVGTNETIIQNLGTLGLQAILLSIGAVAGSVLLAFFTYRFFFKKNV